MSERACYCQNYVCVCLRVCGCHEMMPSSQQADVSPIGLIVIIVIIIIINIIQKNTDLSDIVNAVALQEHFTK